MPSKWEQWAGPAAFIDGWLQQDAAEQKAQLDQLEGLTAAGGRLTQIQGMQATERRTQAMFPGKETIQQQEIQKGGFEVGSMERTSELQAQMDQVMNEKYGIPFELFKALSDAKQVEVLNQLRDTQLQLGTPADKARAESLATEEDITKLETRKELDATGTEVRAGVAEAKQRTVQAQYNQQVLQLKQVIGMPELLVNTEQALMTMAPTIKKAEFLNTLADIQAKQGRYAASPAGQDDALRQALARYGIDLDKWIIREALIKRGDYTKHEVLMDNIRTAESTIAQLQTQKNDLDGAMAFMMTFLQDNPYIASDTAAGTKEDPKSVEEIIKPLEDYVRANKTLLWTQHRMDYDKLVAAEFKYTVKDIDQLVGRMQREAGPNTKFSGFQGDKGIRDDITQKLVNLINERNFGIWEMFWQKHRDAMVQRWGEENWVHGLNVLRWVLWEQGKDANLSGAPAHATWIGTRGSIVAPPSQTTRQMELESSATGGLDDYIDRLMQEAGDTMNIQGLEREFESLLPQGVQP